MGRWDPPVTKTLPAPVRTRRPGLAELRRQREAVGVAGRLRLQTQTRPRALDFGPGAQGRSHSRTKVTRSVYLKDNLHALLHGSVAFQMMAHRLT